MTISAHFAPANFGWNGAALVVVATGLAGCTNVSDFMDRGTNAQRTAEERAASELSGVPGDVIAARRGIDEQIIGRPYKINNVWYFPKAEDQYDRVGIASWYGEKFHGRKTANGETYDMNDYTAAHTTLPLPSYVEVTNLATGRQAVLRVNDRGPFVDGRLIDVSKAAARRLGFMESGLGHVRVRLLDNETGARLAAAQAKEPVTQVASLAGAAAAQPTQVAGSVVASRPTVSVVDVRDAALETGGVAKVEAPAPRIAATPAKSSAGGLAYVVQVGAFGVEDNALRLREKLAARFPAHIAPKELSGGRTLHRVRLGPFDNREAAERALDAAVSDGFGDARILRSRA